MLFQHKQADEVQLLHSLRNNQITLNSIQENQHKVAEALEHLAFSLGCKTDNPIFQELIRIVKQPETYHIDAQEIIHLSNAARDYILLSQQIHNLSKTIQAQKEKLQIA